MSDKHIPQDIMEAAQNAFEAAMSHHSDTKSEVEIALAILAERERCLSIVRNEIDENDPLDTNASDMDIGWSGCAEKIEALIREGYAA